MIACLSAPEARTIAKTDIEPSAMTRAILLAAYAAIYTAAVCGHHGTVENFDGIDEDEDEDAVARGLKEAAELLRKNGYRVTIQGRTCADIEWSGK